MSTELVQRLSRLIAMRTDNPGTGEPAMAAALEQDLARHAPDSLEVIEVPHGKVTSAAVLARWGRPSLLVNAHLDTVPPNRGWSGDPFVARIDGDRLVGLGSADTKGAIAAILCALEEARPRDTAVLFSGDEELDNHCMRTLVERGTLAGVERAIVCEPTSLRYGTRHRGILSLEVTANGPGGHSSFADTLPSPLGDLARLATRLDDWGRGQRNVGPDGFTGMCLNVAKLDGGVAFNVIASQATLTVSLRPPPGTDVPATQRKLEAIIREVVPSARATWLMANPPFETRDPAWFSSLLGERPLLDLGFWTEAALLPAAGIDAVVIGPGDIALAHSPDESVPIADLVAAQQMFARLFKGA
ncbi:MAG: M20/M25/M40 family metallo-hydrolase [Polyangia bacterium]